MLWTILIVLLILALLGGGFGFHAGYAPYGYGGISIGFVLLVVLIVLLIR